MSAFFKIMSLVFVVVGAFLLLLNWIGVPVDGLNIWGWILLVSSIPLYISCELVKILEDTRDTLGRIEKILENK